MNLLKQKTKDPINTFVVPFMHPEYIEGCVKSIWKFCSPEEHRLIVVDNGCKKDLYPKLKDKVHLYIRSYRNLGCAKAWNIGPQLSHTKYISILGDDTRIIHKRWWAEVLEFIEEDPTGIWFCHPCHMTEPEKKKGNLEPPRFTDAMWEETKARSGDMVGRFNCLILGRRYYFRVVYKHALEGTYLFNENLYPCQYVDRDFHNRLIEKKIPKMGIHFPVWHMRAMTFQRGKMPMHDTGMSQSQVEREPVARRYL